MDIHTHTAKNRKSHELEYTMRFIGRIEGNEFETSIKNSKKDQKWATLTFFFIKVHDKHVYDERQNRNGTFFLHPKTISEKYISSDTDDIDPLEVFDNFPFFFLIFGM